jgi:glycosyltransferase involved in cell wall biosynthesis
LTATIRAFVPERHDVAVYSPWGSLFYASGKTGGGAEFQALTLARELASSGLRVAHVVFPVDGARPLPAPAPTVVERSGYRGDIPAIGAGVEAFDVWRGLARANARCYVIRGSGGYMAAASAYCRVHRRRLIFSSSNDLDYHPTREDRGARVWRSYRHAVTHADQIVAQTGHQLELAEKAFPDVPATHIPSFAQPAEPSSATPDAFLWADRLVDYKRPELFLDLAEALPDLPFRMILVTTAETAWYPELVERVSRRAGELANVELLDTQPRPELLDYISRAIAVVKTSEVEGMPNTFLEAWARGVPVLSFSVDPDARIADNDIGIVAGSSMERFAQGARDLAGNPRLRAEMAGRARAFIEEVHSPPAVARRWQAVIERLLR